MKSNGSSKEKSESVLNSSQSSFLWRENQDGEWEAKPTGKAFIEIERNRLKAKYRESGLPEDRFDLKLRDFKHYDDMIAEGAEEYVQDWRDYGTSIHAYFHGPQNTGKTFVASWIGKELLKEGFSVRFIIMNELLRLLQNQWDEDWEERLKVYHECDLLILDQCFQSDQVTIYRSGYQIPFLDTFLKIRMEVRNKPVIFTSNVRISEIPQVYQSVINLILRKTTTVEFTKTLDIPSELGSRIWKRG